MNRRVLAVVVVLAAAACSGDDDAGPSPTTRPTTPTTVVDRSGIVLPRVGGETTTTIDERGTAVLVGTVRGPAGPLATATVRVERLVAGREIRRDAVTDADGRWELRGVPGGRYRVRAFLAPVYAQTDADVRFLADGEEHRYDLVVDDQRSVVVRADVAPDAPLVGGAVNLVVAVARRTVDADGIVRAAPAAGTVVELTGLGRWVLRDDGTTTDTADLSDPPRATSIRLSDAGRARFELVCRAAGAPGLALRVPVVVQAPPGVPSTTATTAPLVTREEVRLELPDCAVAGQTTSTTTAP